jgi:hypothetical protein
VTIKQTFPIVERGEIRVHLAGHKWEFQKFCRVVLTTSGQSFVLNYVGFGDPKGTPVLTLKPIENAAETIAAIARLTSGTPFERTLSRADT